MAVFIGKPRVGEGDFLNGSFEPLDPDAVVDFEEVAENERKASKKVRREFFRCEREDESAYSGTGKERGNVHSSERKDEYASKSPEKNGGGVFEKRQELFRERARPHDLGKRFVQNHYHHYVRKPKPRECGENREGLVGHVPIWLGSRNEAYERFPSVSANERLECGKYRERRKGSEEFHGFSGEKYPVMIRFRKKSQNRLHFFFGRIYLRSLSGFDPRRLPWIGSSVG